MFSLSCCSLYLCSSPASQESPLSVNSCRANEIGWNVLPSYSYHSCTSGTAVCSVEVFSSFLWCHKKPLPTLATPSTLTITNRSNSFEALWYAMCNTAGKPKCCIEVGFILIFFLFNWLDEYIQAIKGKLLECWKAGLFNHSESSRDNGSYRASLCHCIRKVIVRKHLGGISS